MSQANYKPLLSELQILIMQRDNCASTEAQELIDEMRALIDEGEDPEDVLHDEGFESDYVFELI